MSGKVLMVQGTASGVGKSFLVTALCRLLARRGLRVAPFKAQNMALNSYVTPDGREIARAQAVQAEAAGVEPRAEMNPILLKPEADARSQVVLLGRPLGSLSAQEYYRRRGALWEVVLSSLQRLREEFDLVVVEGAGSPAEVNLRERDIANMRLARAVRAPVLLVGDIERGGVFASLVGTLSLLTPAERRLVRGLLINRFRGDPALLAPGLRFLEGRTGRPVLGVIPYVPDLRLPAEDSLGLEERRGRDGPALLEVAVLRLPRIANFDDLDPLEDEEGVRVRWVDRPEDLGRPDLLVLPGSKTTIPDLLALRERGLAGKVVGLARRGTPVVGLCGGYQMMGLRLRDPEGVESPVPEVEGLGLLPVETEFFTGKETHRARGVVVAGEGLLEGMEGMEVQGYEVHMGRTRRLGGLPLLHLRERSGRPADLLDGCVAGGGLVLGTYLHGLFHNTPFRRALLQNLARRKGLSLPSGSLAPREAVLDAVADLVERSVDLPRLFSLCGLE